MDELENVTQLAPVKRFLSAEDVEAVNDRPTVDLEVPEWGGWVRVRALSLGAYLDIKREATDADGRDNEDELTARMLAAALVGDDGAPMFSLERARGLRDKSASALGLVMQAVASVTGSGGDVLEEAERTFRART
jgi:hypothetical protein